MSKINELFRDAARGNGDAIWVLVFLALAVGSTLSLVCGLAVG